MTGRGSGRGTRWLVGAVVVLLGVSLFLYVRLHQFSDQAAVVQSRLLRLDVRDAQLGTRLPNRPLPVVGETARREPLHRAGTPHVIWVIDPTRCPQCLEGAGEWRHLLQTSELRGVVILEGVGDERARRVVKETALAGTVLLDSAARWREGRPPGQWPGMTVFGATADGRIRTVASRMARGTCRWSPFDYTLSVMRPP